MAQATAVSLAPRVVPAVAIVLCMAIVALSSGAQEAPPVSPPPPAERVGADSELMAAQERVFAAALARIAPCMVRVDTVGGALPVVKETDDSGREVTVALFRQADGPTTGLIWRADGMILSSSINFMREPSVTTVTLADGRRFVATLVARDRGARLALLKIDATGLPVAERAPDDGIRPGQWALAAGFGHGSRTPTLSVGCVSAVDRTLGLTIQTDAKISPANYGGPLLDSEGRLLGLCVPRAGQGDSELAGVEWYDSGIGFAVRNEELSRRFERLSKGQDLHAGQFPVLFDPLHPVVGSTQPSGVRVLRVPEASELPDGLRAEDLVVAADGRLVISPLDLLRAAAQKHAGDVLHMNILRDGVPREVDVRLIKEDELARRLMPAPADSRPAG